MGTDFTLRLCGLGPAVEPLKARFLMSRVGIFYLIVGYSEILMYSAGCLECWNHVNEDRTDSVLSTKQSVPLSRP